MVTFVAFLVVLGFGFDLFVLGLQETHVPIGAIIALGVGSVSAGASYFAGDRAVLLSTGAVPLDKAIEAASTPDERQELRQLDNVVDEIAIASGIPRPKVYVVPDCDPNAYATGRSPAHASLAVTHGLLEALNREELQAVVAHEMGHIRNYDIRLMTVVAALVGAVALLADWAARGMYFGRSSSRGSSRDRDGGGSVGGALGLVFLVVWLVAIVLAPLAARLLALGVSRQREYLADASSAELTRNPHALAEALQKIEGATGPTRAIKSGSAHLCIADPRARLANEREGLWANLWATHPPMSKRIAALRAMGYERPSTA